MTWDHIAVWCLLGTLLLHQIHINHVAATLSSHLEAHPDACR